MVTPEHKMKNKLKKILEDTRFEYFELTDYCIARTKGRLLVTRNNINSYGVEYMPDGDFFEGVNWLAENSDEAVEMIQGLTSSSLYVNYNTLLTEKELETYNDICECLLFFSGHDKNCYVCGENAYCFMTECQHTICVYCYRKSIDKQHKFTCGLCRHTVTLNFNK